MTLIDFKSQVQEGIPAEIPSLRPTEEAVNHAPKRKQILNIEEKKLAIKK